MMTLRIKKREWFWVSFSIFASSLSTLAFEVTSDSAPDPGIIAGNVRLGIVNDSAADPYQWLEDIHASRSLDWVKEKTQSTVSTLSAHSRYAAIADHVKKILNSDDRIAYPDLRGGYVYNFWQDEGHIQGIWRRARLADYQKNLLRANWEILLDIDELSRVDSVTWVFGGADCLAPDYNRCIIRLSDGGRDASVFREFDLTQKAFVPAPQGFHLSETKGFLTWLDADHAWVGANLGPETCTVAGYPRQIKVWTRGQSLAQATLIFTGAPSDAYLHAWTLRNSKGNDVHVVWRSKSFHEFEVYTLPVDTTGKSIENIAPQTIILQKLPFPLDAEFVGFHHEKFFFRLRREWKIGVRQFSAGIILALARKDIAKPSVEENVEVVHTPKPGEAYEKFFYTQEQLFLIVYKSVQARLLRLDQDESGHWQSTALAYPDHGSIQLISVDPDGSQFITNYSSFLTPPSLFLSHEDPAGLVGSHPVLLYQTPPQFDARDLVVRQEFATSRDGTLVPYFIIHKKTLKLNGKNPTLLYAYGGFEYSLAPNYDGVRGKVWLEQGGVFVSANIRGGGEFGPDWHAAALRTNRQRAFDDFIAVGENLIARGVTSPPHLGIQGRSNGGLLVGATFIQRPEMFNAVICGVPLLDMIRFPLLLAGHLWKGEYGDPADPTERAALLKYSPYQNLQRNRQYPEVFFFTSTLDDRVHPGHARKMKARMEEMGHPAFYFENIEGGHAGTANVDQLVQLTALEFTYLFDKLF